MFQWPMETLNAWHIFTVSQLPIPGKAPWYRGQWCSLIFKKWSESWDEVLSVPRPNLSVPFQIDSLIEVVQVRNVKQCFPQCFAYLNMYEGAQLASLFHGTNSLAYYSTRFLIGVSLWGTWNTLTHGRELKVSLSCVDRWDLCISAAIAVLRTSCHPVVKSRSVV